MSLVRWNDEGRSAGDRALGAAGTVVAMVALLVTFTPFSRIFALPWVLGRADVLGWWPVDGLWHWIGVGALCLAILIPVWCYSEGRSPRTVLGVGAACVAIALALLLWGGRSRIEVRANDIRVTSDRWVEADVVYRIDNAAGMTASCETGSKGRVYPSLWVWFHDGRELELERLTSRGANPGATRAGLDFAEGLDIFLVHHGNRRSGTIEDRCVEKVEGRLAAADAPRIGALFTQDLFEVVDAERTAP
jgi:hypothetical protein